MTNQNTELRQLNNTVEIVGTLKSHDLQKKVSKKGNNYISGKLVIQSKFADRINEIPVKVLVVETSKLYSGVETVMEEYKTIEAHGLENADRIKVTGNIKLNEYQNRNGQLVQFNEVSGVFYNRLTDANDQPDKAIASIETVVQKFEPIVDADNLPTGDYAVRGFTVNYGSEVTPFMNAIVKSELAEMFMSLYNENSTGRLTYQINNYVVVKEIDPALTSAVHGFGSTQSVEAQEAKDYVNNLEIIGGDQPFFGTIEYTPEEIERAEAARRLVLAELQNSASNTPPINNTGFGANTNTTAGDVSSQLPSGMGNGSELPSF